MVIEMGAVIDKMTEPEKQVAEFLDELRLWYKYKFPVFLYDDKERSKVWTPDLFLPKLGVYIKICGSRAIDYAYREKIFDKNGIYIIFVHHYKEERVWKQFLVERLEYIEEKRLSLISEAIELAKKYRLEK